jgi:biofilm PGA synthesis N-glycosyltransferase PgaC
MLDGLSARFINYLQKVKCKMNVHILGAICLLFCMFYIAILVCFYIVLRGINHPRKFITPTVSLVIAARNEQNRIVPFLQTLELVEYPSNQLEVVFIDDASTDATATMIEQYCKQHPNWRLLRFKNKRGQIAAISEGIASSKGEIIVNTDADCLVQREWLREIISCFAPDVSMVLGYSPFVHNSKIIYWYMAFDNIVSAISQAVFTKIGFPLSSTGRNLAYRRTAYNSVGGYSSLMGFRSGTDTHLTLLFKKNKIGRMVYCLHPKSFVQTQAPEKLLDVFFREVRRNSLTFKRPFPCILFSIAAFLSYISPFLLLCLSLPWPLIGISLLLLRYLIEFTCIKKGANMLKEMHLSVSFPIMQLIYPICLLFFNVLGASQLYHWKE